MLFFLALLVVRTRGLAAVPTTSRRAALVGLSGALAQPVFAEEIPSIKETPRWTLLLPLVDLHGALTAWQTDSKVEEKLGKLTEKGLFSSKNFIYGVGYRYISLIQYDDIDKSLIRKDKDKRMGLLVARSAKITFLASSAASFFLF